MIQPASNTRVRILLRGSVQGAGVRPSLYRYARSSGVNGWIANSPEGVVIEAEGPAENVRRFSNAIPTVLPGPCRISRMDVKSIPLNGDEEFVIRVSETSGGTSISIPPDLAMCDDCRNELFSPAAARYRYPFTNCSVCGPRYTILRDLPYDRKNTTMSGFDLCASCQREYSDPADRRFHAEPVACPQCGPQTVFYSAGNEIARQDGAVLEAVKLLEQGGILALKGIGGFHLSCLAEDTAAVLRLREKKARPHKPFAAMAKDAETALKYCNPDEQELALLQSAFAPVVMIRSHSQNILSNLSPGLDRIGVMLPYTPLHTLLFQSNMKLLVMTSGNLSDEPICKSLAEAREKLSDIAAGFLTHNRTIENRLDDSVMFFADSKPRFLRRARGAVPLPIPIAHNSPRKTLLGVGAEIKNTFCILKGDHAYLSPHIGDLNQQSSMASFEETLKRFEYLLRTRPQIIAHDMHPDYLSTQWAQNSGAGVQRVPVQHHHAHIASVLAEHQVEGPVIGVAFDGSGMGADKTIWGGEFLIVNGATFSRAGHLRAFPLPGGDICAREIWRNAFSILLDESGSDRAINCIPDKFRKFSPDLLKVCRDSKLSPLSTSAGRLFDAVGSILGLRQEATYEGQAAMELESLARRAPEGSDRGYTFKIETRSSPLILDPAPVLESLLSDRLRGITADTSAFSFQQALVRGVAQSVTIISEQFNVRVAALSGGCFQNKFLLEGVTRLLNHARIKCLSNQSVPANDGGISLGQVWVASRAANGADSVSRG